MIKKITYFLPSILIMSTIFFLSSRYSTGIGGSLTQQFIIHKSLHIFVYSLLGASLLYAFFKISAKFDRQAQILSVLFTYIYGITDEIHQSFVPGREGKFTDTLFDLAGALLGLYLYKIFRNCQINYQSNRNH